MSSKDRNKEDAIDRLSHCSDKVFALSCMDLGLIGRSEKGSNGLDFLLLNLSNELEEIEEELRAEKGNLKVVSDK